MEMKFDCLYCDKRATVRFVRQTDYVESEVEVCDDHEKEGALWLVKVAHPGRPL